MLDSLQRWLRRGVDVRPGEYSRTLLVFLYLLFVLLAYYILKPVSRAMFLNQFDAERLPYLYMWTAIAGGLLAYSYSRVAVRFSLQAAVHWATALVAASLLIIWVLLTPDRPWMYYVFNVWVSLCSLVLVSQGWLIASQVFQPWEAKRLYGLLAGGSVLGAALGGSFTAWSVRYLGTSNLLPASVGFVALAYVCFLLLIRLPDVSLEGARGAEVEETEFRLRDVAAATMRYPHLQIIIGILTITYLVDTLVDFQFNSMARAQHSGDNLTAFLGGFYGLYLNLATFVLQVFLTSFVVNRWGVGGTLMVMPVGIGISSVVMLASPGVLAAAVTRLVEASSRYSFNRTGMELLYLPLPTDLKTRTKAFVDVFVDRAARGLGAIVLFILTALSMGIQAVTVIVMICCVGWIVLALYARREYVDSVRKRLDARRLEFENVRLSLQDPAVVQLLERSAESDQTRQAAYALSALAELPQYNLRPLLDRIIASPLPTARAQAYETAAKAGVHGYEDRALAELSCRDASLETAGPAAVYLVRTAADAFTKLRRLCLHENPPLAEKVLTAVAQTGFAPPTGVPVELVENDAHSDQVLERRLAALMARFAGTLSKAALTRLMEDPDLAVRQAAAVSVGVLRIPELIPSLVAALRHPSLRSTAVEALARYGDSILPLMRETSTDLSRALSARRQTLRVVERLGTQAALDSLLELLASPESALRWSVLRTLQRMRDRHPDLDYRAISVHNQIKAEVRSYYDLQRALVILDQAEPQTPTVRLLARTLADRSVRAIDRLFRLLGLRYPPREIEAARRAVRRGGKEDLSNALEFLDTILERDLKKTLLPLLDSSDSAMPTVEDRRTATPPEIVQVLRGFIHSGDGWLTVCAMSAAGELKLAELAAEIGEVGDQGTPVLSRVAQSALATMG